MSVTYKPKNKKRFTTHGFLARMASATGRNIIRRRMLKNRTELAPLMGKKLK